MAEFLVLLVYMGLFCGALALAGLVADYFSKLNASTEEPE